MNMKQAKDAARGVAGDDETADGFKVAMILLASANVGPDEATIAKVLGYPADFVSVVGKRMRKSGVWTKRGKIACEWADPEHGGMAFAMDVSVGLGLMERARSIPKSRKVGEVNK